MYPEASVISLRGTNNAILDNLETPKEREHAQSLEIRLGEQTRFIQVLTVSVRCASFPIIGASVSDLPQTNAESPRSFGAACLLYCSIPVSAIKEKLSACIEVLLL